MAGADGTAAPAALRPDRGRGPGQRARPRRQLRLRRLCSWICLAGLALAARPLAEAAPKRPGWATRGSRLEFQSLWFRNCEDSVPLPLRVGAMVAKPKPGGGQLFDLNFTVARAAKRLRSVRVKIDKCRDRVSVHTCEYFTTFNWMNGMCALIVAPDMAWSPVINSIQPPVSCPITKGVYRTVNASVDMEAALTKNFMMDGIVWKGVLTANDHDDAPWLCLSAAVLTKKTH